ncbi:uncharacterized protein LOC122662997 [Telopea speciosissima]|uniref:uncharacterized protein LOC122662997 n=1 Tax=Telopea speciosissima TaxID=54955 RepID=UPI001CC5CDDE|nr:uncharacterized protein LOC122662997 [Telopea speciosissima]
MVKNVQNCSWVWRKILKYRDKVEPHVRTLIGDGRSTSIWLDKWHPLGILINRFGNKICYDARAYHIGSRTALVEEIIRDGEWLPGPSTSFDLIDTWRELPSVERLLPGDKDLIAWIGNSLGIFTAKSAWDLVRVQAAKLEWSEGIWFEGNIPR